MAHEVIEVFTMAMTSTAYTTISPRKAARPLLTS